LRTNLVMKNPTMKSIQMMLYSYYLIKGLHNKESSIDDIILMSASNKLKVYNGETIECDKKSKYSKNKYLAIKHTQYFLNERTENLDFFNSHNKKDDLADAYLQGIYYLNKFHLNKY